MTFQPTDLPRLLPELMLILLALLVVGTDVLERWGHDAQALAERTQAAAQLAAVGLGLVLALVLVQSRYLFTVPQPTGGGIADRVIGLLYNLQQAGPGGQAILGAFAVDDLTMIARIVFAGAALLTVLLTMGYKPRGNPGEFYGLILFSTAGMCLMAGASELILAFLALELASIPLYVLAGYFRTDPRSSEAGMKYFLFGVFSSAILLYGMSLAYGLAASAHGQSQTGAPVIATLFTSLAAAGAQNGGALLFLSLLFIVAGIGYKLTVVPFHAWAPDVYEGAPTAISAFISTASKTAGFVLLFRLLTSAFPAAAGTVGLTRGWVALLALLALATIIFGNMAALPQRNAKRLLAYSSIGHAGFVLLALLLWPSPSLGAREFSAASLVYYLVAYTLTNLGAFGALAVVSEQVGGDDLADLAGLSRRNLPLAVLLTLFVLSLAGVPPLAGFWGKFFVFMAAYQAGAVWLFAVAVLMTVVSLYYYLRLLKAMWFDAPASVAPLTTPRPMQAALLVACALMIGLGLFPNLVWNLFLQVGALAGR